MVGLHFVEKALPLAPGLSVVEEEMGTVFVAEIFAVFVSGSRPMLMRNDVADRDLVFPHQFGGKAGGAINGGGSGVACVLTHFNADGLAVSGPFIVGVLSLFVGRETLVDRMVIDREMPGEVS